MADQEGPESGYVSLQRRSRRALDVVCSLLGKEIGGGGENLKKRGNKGGRRE